MCLLDCDSRADSRPGVSLCLYRGKANMSAVVVFYFSKSCCCGWSWDACSWCLVLTTVVFAYDCRAHPCAVSQPEACVSMEAVSDSHTVTVSMDSSEISMIIDSIKKECLGSAAGSTAGSSKDHCMDGKEDLDLAEKMDIAVSYTGEELDFDTVGNIIAIIEDKVKRQNRGPVAFAPRPVRLISRDLKLANLIHLYEEEITIANGSFSQSLPRSVGNDHMTPLLVVCHD